MNAELDGEFREFMHARWPAMVRLAYALTGDQGYAEDVAQAAFARAYASWPKVSRAGNPEAYVRRIVVNENLNRFRKHRVAERLTGTLPESGTPDATRTSDDRSALIAALQQLGPRQRAVVGLRYWLDLSETEVAAVAVAVPLVRHGTRAASPASGHYTGSGTFDGKPWSATTYAGP